MREFWVASGHHLGRRTARGWLGVTDDLLRAWLVRPEVMPPQDACGAERALHARLMAAPRAAIAPGEIAALDDPDARENWGWLIAFRDRLIAKGTIEAAYLELVRESAALPPLFMIQLVQLVLRNALDGCDDPFVLRAAELFWRSQRASVREGALVLADAERIEAMEAEASASPLMAMLGRGADELDLMTEANAWTYWSQSDAHAMALAWGADPRARAGLATAIVAFLRHLTGIETRIETLASVEEVDLLWYVGLDRDATLLGDALWRGEAAAEPDRLIGLFRLDFDQTAPVDPRIAGHPVWLLLAMTPDWTVRMKPQNLILGLPLASPAQVV